MYRVTLARSKAIRLFALLALVVYYSLTMSMISAQAGPKDSDGDGMPDKWEINHQLNAHKANAHGDPDHDGLVNIKEFKNHTEPKDEDSDDDGSDDGDEVKSFDTDPTDDDSDDDGIEDGDEDSDEDGVDDEDEDDLDENCKADDDDGDHDGIDDEDEDDFGTDPDDSDSDDDGVEDGNEDSDADGVDDEDESDESEDDEDDCDDSVGTIVSYDSATGTLTISTPSGGSITGTVTDETELEWDGEGSGCSGGDEATTADLQPGTGVEDLDFEDDGTTFEEVELVCSV